MKNKITFTQPFYPGIESVELDTNFTDFDDAVETIAVAVQCMVYDFAMKKGCTPSKPRTDDKIKALVRSLAYFMVNDLDTSIENYAEFFEVRLSDWESRAKWQGTSQLC